MKRKYNCTQRALTQEPKPFDRSLYLSTICDNIVIQTATDVELQDFFEQHADVITHIMQKSPHTFRAMLATAVVQNAAIWEPRIVENFPHYVSAEEERYREEERKKVAEKCKWLALANFCSIYKQKIYSDRRNLSGYVVQVRKHDIVFLADAESKNKDSRKITIRVKPYGISWHNYSFSLKRERYLFAIAETLAVQHIPVPVLKLLFLYI